MRPAGPPLSLEDARRLVQDCAEHCSNVRLNSAIGYITPKDMLAGRQHEIHAERSETGGGAETKAGPSPAGHVKNEAPTFRVLRK